MKRVLFGCAVALLTAGCGLVDSEDGFEGTVLALVEVEGQSMPAQLTDGEFMWTFVADTIWLADDGGWNRRTESSTSGGWTRP